jgi:hypothetical protein
MAERRYFETRELAIAAWNLRPVDPLAQQMAEALKRADTLLVALQPFVYDNADDDDTVEYGGDVHNAVEFALDANFAVTDIRAALAAWQEANR